jgi:hypothetical protein
MPKEFIDRREMMFGREPDVARLVDRAQSTGSTVLTGRARMGKSWLLEAVALRLSGQGFLVGLHECQGTEPDAILRATRDLYDRWLADSNYLQQARKLWQQNKKGFVTRAGIALGKLFGSILDVQHGDSGVVKDAIGMAFDGLEGFQRDLVTGGLPLPPLDYEQMHELLSTVSDLSGKPIVLILDQWEKSRDKERDCNILDTFLRHHSEWPHCHILAAAKDGRFNLSLLEGLVRVGGGAAECGPLDKMHLQDGEDQEALAYIRSKNEVAVGVEDADLLKWMKGYPGVVEGWLSPYGLKSIKNPGDMRKAAKSAWHNSYAEELESCLPGLTPDLRRFTIRLAIMAEMNELMWGTLREIVTNDIQGDALDELCVAGVLREMSPPSFGHDSRHEAVRNWYVSKGNLLAIFRKEVETIICSLGALVSSTEAETLPHSLALVGISQNIDGIDVRPSVKLLLAAATTLFPGLSADVDRHLREVGIEWLRQHRDLLPLVAMGLVNTLNRAKAEDDLSRRDVLLDRLRWLQQAFPKDAVVREQLAMGLFNTHIDVMEKGDSSRENPLYDELRALHGSFRKDANVRKWFARDMVNTHAHAMEAGQFLRRNSLLDKLRILHQDFQDDAEVRAAFASGLFNTLYYAKAEDDLSQRDAMLDELRRLRGAAPNDAGVGVQLAKGLFNTLVDATAENDLSRRDALLAELRALRQGFPDDAAVRERLAMALFNTFHYAKAENDLPRRDALLEELRALHGAFLEDAALRENLAVGLFNTLNDANEENDLARRDALLDELRILHGAFPEDAAMREWFAKGLFNMSRYAKAENDLSRRDALLDELRALHDAFPEDAGVREQLIKGFATTHRDLRSEGDRERSDVIALELRAIARQWPDDELVQKAIRYLDEQDA